GGEVINSSDKNGFIAVNGMSESRRDGINSNSAVLVSVNPEDLSDNVFSGMEFQEKIEKAAYKISDGAVPVTTVGEFVFSKNTPIGRVKPTVKPKYAMADFNEIFPPFICESLKKGIIAFDGKIKGFADCEAVLTAPETRSSSPVRIKRNEDMVSSIDGVYPCGEGAGYAGGITSAAVDGIKVAESIILRFQKTN
ncbi:MAG: FAD-dependent oxidoreductase, partial [Clostridia bacterium]|nr:FAD-dependent oxidoreductase [Clostridia bacterium]